MEKDEAKPRAFPWAAISPGPPEQSEGNPAPATTKDGSVYLLVRFLFVHPSLHH